MSHNIYACGLIALCSLSGNAAAGLTDGLIGYWPWDQGGTDMSGFGRDMYSTSSLGNGPGLFGNSLSLNGNDDNYAARPIDDEVFDFGGSDFTVSIWMWYHATPHEQVMIEKFYGQSGPGWTLTTLASNAIQFYSNGSPVLQTPPLTITLETWHHVLVRRSGSGFELLYDGVVLTSALRGGVIGGDAMPLIVGKRNVYDGRHFATDGYVDEVAIWNRALSDGEIAQIWNGGAGNPIIMPCFADFNADGGVDGSDVDAFFADWSEGLSTADVNADGGIDGADVQAFFDQWVAGGC